MNTMPHKMLCFAVFAALVALAIGEAATDDVSVISGETPKPDSPITTDASPPREAVADIFAAPLASFKVPAAMKDDDELELAGLPLGKADNATDSSTPPPFSNLWFNAGQSLGSAANSLTGWLNSRLGQTTTTTTTTRPPEVIVRVQSQQAKRKPLISIDPNRNQQGNRISPGLSDDDENEDEDDDEEDEDYDADEEDEQTDDAEEPTPNRYSGVENEEVSEEEPNDEEELDEDEEEEEEKPVKKRRKYPKAPPRRSQRPVNSNEADDDEYADDYEEDDDTDNYEPSNTYSGRQQQQQSLFNRFRQLASSNNKKKATSQPNKGYRPVRIIQNGQVIQLVEDRPSQQKIKGQKRPSGGQQTYQLVQIQPNQMAGGQQQKKRRVPKPDTASNIYIPLPQGVSDSNKGPGQYITIPWSQLGITNNKQDSQNGQQQAPFIVNLPQLQGSNRRRPAAQVPVNLVSNPQRKRLRPNKNQKAQVISLLSEQNIRDIFKIPEIPPSRNPLKPVKPVKPLEVPVDDDSTTKPLSINPQTEVVSEDNDDEENDESQDPYIVVGEDESNDQPMSRHASASRLAHIGGMKPYVDVLNKGRIYLRPARQTRRSRELLTQSDDPQATLAINPEPIEEPDKDVIQLPEITTESSSKTNPNDLPSLSILEPDNASTPTNPLLSQQ